MWTLNRKPNRCSRERTSISGCVSRPRMRLITQLRFSSEKISTNLSVLPYQKSEPKCPGAKPSLWPLRISGVEYI